MERLRRPSESAFAAAFMALGTLVFGWDYLVGNQNTYLVHALRLIDPSFLAMDWFAAETTPYHDRFPGLIALLHRIGPLALTTSLANSLLIAGGYAAVWGTLKRVAGREALLIFGMVALVWLAGTESVAVTSIFGSYLQPSSLGGAGFLVALFAFALGRHLLAGIALAVGGYFHLNYLLLTFPVFGLVSLLMGKEDRWRRTGRVCLPPLLVLLASLPILLKVASDPLADEGARIFTQIRSPWHYRPSEFLDDFHSLIAWAGSLVLSFRMNWVRDERWRALLYLALVMAGLIALATALTTVVYLLPVAQLFFWRLAPFLVTLCAVLLGDALFSEEDSGSPLLRAFGGALLLGYLLSLWRLPGYFERFSDLYVLGAALLLFTARQAIQVLPLRPGRTSAALRTPFLALVGVICLAAALQQLRREYWEITGVSGEEELYAFAAGTGPESLFLIPPELEDFRLRSQRAVVVDWKSTPYQGSELVAWYSRINAIAGREVLRKADAVQGYARMDSGRLEALQRRFRITHVVFRRESKQGLAGQKPVFENEGYVVYLLKFKMMSESEQHYIKQDSILLDQVFSLRKE